MFPSVIFRVLIAVLLLIALHTCYHLKWASGLARQQHNSTANVLFVSNLQAYPRLGKSCHYVFIGSCPRAYSSYCGNTSTIMKGHDDIALVLEHFRAHLRPASLSCMRIFSLAFGVLSRSPRIVKSPLNKGAAVHGADSLVQVKHISLHLHNLRDGAYKPFSSPRNPSKTGTYMCLRVLSHQYSIQR